MSRNLQKFNDVKKNLKDYLYLKRKGKDKNIYEWKQPGCKEALSGS